LQHYLAGRDTWHLVQDLSCKLLEAELELAAGAAERVAAHERHFDVMRKMDKLVKKRFEAREVNSAHYHEVRAARLKAEIGLRRAGGKPKPEGK
jgi:hypothetical protein